MEAKIKFLGSINNKKQKDSSPYYIDGNKNSCLYIIYPRTLLFNKLYTTVFSTTFLCLVVCNRFV